MDNFLNFFYSYLDKNQRKKLFILNDKKHEISFFNQMNEEVFEKIQKKIIYKEIYFFKKCNIQDLDMINKIREEIFLIFKQNLNTVLNNYFTLIFSDNFSNDINSKIHTVSTEIGDFFDKNILPIENNFYYESKNFLNIGHFLNSYYEDKIDIFTHSNSTLTVNILSSYYINDFDFFFIDYIDKCIRFVMNKYSLLDNYYLKDSHLVEDKKISTDICTYISNLYIEKIFSLKMEKFKEIFDYFNYLDVKVNNYQIKKYNNFNFQISNLIDSIKNNDILLFINDNEYNLNKMDHKSILKIKNQINAYYFKNIDFKFVIKEISSLNNFTKINGFYFSSLDFFQISKHNYVLNEKENISQSFLISNFLNHIY